MEMNGPQASMHVRQTPASNKAQAQAQAQPCLRNGSGSGRGSSAIEYIHPSTRAMLFPRLLFC